MKERLPHLVLVVAASVYGIAPLSSARTFAAEASSAPSRFFQPVQPPRPFQVMVHRGIAEAAPENTRPAIEMAIEDGLEWVEIDVRLTADGQHVLFHDDRLDGKTNGRGSVAEKTLAELQSLDAGSWFAPRYAGTRLLSLPEALALAKGRVNYYLDAKSFDPARLVNEIRSTGMEEQVVVYAALEQLRRVRKASDGKVATMCKWRPGNEVAALKAGIAPAIVEIDANEVTPEICRQFHEQRIQVQAKVLGPWDRVAVWSRMLDAGVDYLQTDRPGEILALHLARLYGEGPRPVLMTCHRGASRYAPENTLAAIERAIVLGADYVEIDVRTTSDGRQFLLHDSALDRTTSGQGAIRGTDSATVAQLDAGSWFGKPYAGQKVPTLDAVLEASGGKIGIYFDAKEITPEVLVTSLRAHDLVARTIVFQGPGYLNKVWQLEPGLRLLAPLVSKNSLEPMAKKLTPHAVDVGWKDLSAELIERCHTLGIKVYADAPDEATVADYLRAIDWKIDQIQTDQPLRLMRAMELRATATN
ncbi:MAG: glycerophosphodiester phosphodiesterase family protein [Pirellulales bacterium]|nr:glycerophosphodiester phosphodiesterase family protein [Pirellulales bacterium]